MQCFSARISKQMFAVTDFNRQYLSTEYQAEISVHDNNDRVTRKILKANTMKYIPICVHRIPYLLIIYQISNFKF